MRPARAGLTVVPGHSSVAGKSVGVYTADWWNWAASIPAPGPIADQTGAQATANQSGPVFFIAGTGSGIPPVNRTFDVPQGKYLLFPLLNWIVANGPDPGFADTKSEAIALATNTIDPAKLFATLDGKAVTGLASHREHSGALHAQCGGRERPLPSGHVQRCVRRRVLAARPAAGVGPAHAPFRRKHDPVRRAGRAIHRRAVHG